MELDNLFSPLASLSFEFVASLTMSCFASIAPANTKFPIFEFHCVYIIQLQLTEAPDTIQKIV